VAPPIGIEEYGLDPKYASYYRKLYKTHWWWRMRERWVLDVIRRAQPRSGWRNILDIGCGDALFFDRLADYGDVEGIEPDRSLVSEANPHRSQIAIGPFDESFCPGKRYGLVLMLDVLEHLHDPLSALCQVAALLENEGNLVLTVPAYNAVWTNHDVLNHHVTRYKKSTLFPIIRAARLEVLESSYWFHWTFPTKLAQRALEKAFRLQPTNPSIPGSVLNKILMGISAVEHSLFRPLHIPFGTSLFVRCAHASSGS
jgi:2-polyprenyl-3-methyl-5-hydroxy-6-metoxy-1,4-benzoquinol methylase